MRAVRRGRAAGLRRQPLPWPDPSPTLLSCSRAEAPPAPGQRSPAGHRRAPFLGPQTRVDATPHPGSPRAHAREPGPLPPEPRPGGRLLASGRRAAAPRVGTRSGGPRNPREAPGSGARCRPHPPAARRVSHRVPTEAAGRGSVSRWRLKCEVGAGAGAGCRHSPAVCPRAPAAAPALSQRRPRRPPPRARPLAPPRPEPPPEPSAATDPSALCLPSRAGPAFVFPRPGPALRTPSPPRAPRSPASRTRAPVGPLRAGAGRVQAEALGSRGQWRSGEAPAAEKANRPSPGPLGAWVPLGGPRGSRPGCPLPAGAPGAPRPPRLLRPRSPPAARAAPRRLGRRKDARGGPARGPPARPAGGEVPGGRGAGAHIAGRPLPAGSAAPGPSAPPPATPETRAREATAFSVHNTRPRKPGVSVARFCGVRPLWPLWAPQAVRGQDAPFRGRDAILQTSKPRAPNLRARERGPQVCSDSWGGRRGGRPGRLSLPPRPRPGLKPAPRGRGPSAVRRPVLGSGVLRALGLQGSDTRRDRFHEAQP